MLALDDDKLQWPIKIVELHSDTANFMHSNTVGLVVPYHIVKRLQLRKSE